VRGLDYYTRTLFEIKGARDKLGAGDTLVGGGRYDGMIKELGGPEVPAIGFAAGIERLLIASEAPAQAPVVNAFVVALGAAPAREALILARELRALGVATEADTRGGSLKSQLRRANALGAPMAILIGDAELSSGHLEVKDLAARTQAKVARPEVARYVAARLRGGAE
jgi:histidyl-tRNA synthetase